MRHIGQSFKQSFSHQAVPYTDDLINIPVLVEGIKGYDGKTISQYVKANFNQGRLDFYNENPDRKRDASQRNVVANAQKQGQEQAGRKSKGASIA